MPLPRDAEWRRRPCKCCAYHSPKIYQTGVTQQGEVVFQLFWGYVMEFVNAEIVIRSKSLLGFQSEQYFSNQIHVSLHDYHYPG